MRKLAWAALPYAAAVFAAEYFLPVKGLPIFAAALFLLGLAAFVFGRRRRLTLVLFAAAVGFFWYGAHRAVTVAPCEALAGEKITVTARVVDFPQELDGYTRVDVRLTDDALPRVRAVFFLYEAPSESLRPGDILEADIRVANQTTRLAAQDVYLRAYANEAVTVTGRWKGAWLYFPQRLSQTVKTACDRVFPAFAAPLVKGMMTGDTNDLKQNAVLYSAMQSCGVTHIVAVSGLHMIYLTGFIQLLLGRGRRSSLVCFPLIILFVLMTGCTPSVVRAAFLQTMMLAAPLFDREADGVTDLSAALALLLLVNPNAIASLSLQLSFAAAAGMLAVTPPLRRWAFRRVRSRSGRYVIDSFSCTLGATVFSMPIAAYYFGCIPLLSAVVNLLCLPLLEGVFCAGYVLSALALVLPRAAALLAWVPGGAVWLCQKIFTFVASLPFACVYTDSVAVVGWLIFAYGLFALTFYRRRCGKKCRYILPAALSISTLCVVMVATALVSRSQASVTVLDVGQGECVVMCDGLSCVVVDCGGKGTAANAGETASAFIRSTGRRSVDLLVLTHLHADHANGVEKLLYAIPVRRLALSAECFDDDDLLADILSAAEQTGTELHTLSGECAMIVGPMQLSLYQPLSGQDENERGLVVAAQIRGTNVLVMGDMDDDGELTLVGQGRANTDILVAGHHGSKYSSSSLFLHAASPEWTVVSVGQNSYGHPTQAAMERIYDYNENVRRTDTDGDVTIRIR